MNIDVNHRTFWLWIDEVKVAPTYLSCQRAEVVVPLLRALYKFIPSRMGMSTLTTIRCIPIPTEKKCNQFNGIDTSSHFQLCELSSHTRGTMHVGAFCVKSSSVCLLNKNKINVKVEVECICRRRFDIHWVTGWLAGTSVCATHRVIVRARNGYHLFPTLHLYCTT